MVIVIPKEINGLAELENKIKEEDLGKLASKENLRRREIEIHMPKFKLEQTLNLESVLNEVSCCKTGKNSVPILWKCHSYKVQQSSWLIGEYSEYGPRTGKNPTSVRVFYKPLRSCLSPRPNGKVKPSFASN